MTQADLLVRLADHELGRAAAPLLVTDRLILRGHTREDFDSCLQLWSDPAVTRFIGGRPSTAEEVWRRMMAYLGHWQMMGYGYFIASDRESGELVGEFGLADFRRDLRPLFEDTPEAGWVMRPQFHGQGLAQEAFSAVLAWADQSRPRTVCMIDPANAASVKLATRLGYTEYTRTTYKDQPTILYARSRRAAVANSA